MKNIVFLLLYFYVVSFAFGNGNSDSTKTKLYPFYFEVSGFVVDRPYNPNFSSTFGYTFPKSNSKRFIKSIQISCLYYQDDQMANYGLYDYFSFQNPYPTSTYRTFSKRDSVMLFYNHKYTTLFSISPEFRVLMSRKKKYQGLFIQIGAGFTQRKCYDNTNLMYEKKNAWNLTSCLGYKLNLGRIFFEPTFGIGFFFSYLKYNNNKNLVLYYNSYNNYVQQQNDNTIESVEVKGNNEVYYHFKNAGLNKPEFFPRIGLNIGVHF